MNQSFSSVDKARAFLSRVDSRVCDQSSTPCTCQEYENMATLCFFVNTTSKQFIVEINSAEQADFLIRVVQHQPMQSTVLRFETKPSSCRLLNIPEGSYKIKIESITRKNQVKCFCGGQMDAWCDSCNVKNFAGTLTSRTPVLSSTVALAPGTRFTSTHDPNIVDLSTLSENGSDSDTDSHRSDQPDDRDTHVVIAVSTCVVLVISLSLFIWQCKGKHIS
ncbi:uncharacterized protein LOC110465150 isoform X2 [Mizuhopecten yessoensis]|uniref:uncharacterized protein LOC110465150 isoform X2 n=1 Tax=Mizuhopecten yessoensis TaxID=6573 RepID=UPI000B458700|nr:uncharacterized protein LOC110465150 isoform X2 [Mizuhopecten yessoensis]